MRTCRPLAWTAEGGQAAHPVHRGARRRHRRASDVQARLHAQRGRDSRYCQVTLDADDLTVLWLCRCYCFLDSLEIKPRKVRVRAVYSRCGFSKSSRNPFQSPGITSSVRSLFLSPSVVCNRAEKRATNPHLAEAVSFFHPARSSLRHAGAGCEIARNGPRALFC